MARVYDWERIERFVSADSALKLTEKLAPALEKAREAGTDITVDLKPVICVTRERSLHRSPHDPRVLGLYKLLGEMGFSVVSNNADTETFELCR